MWQAHPAKQQRQRSCNAPVKQESYQHCACTSQLLDLQVYNELCPGWRMYVKVLMAKSAQQYVCFAWE